MRIPFRILTAAALLLHSIFGCGVHDVCGCQPNWQGRSALDSSHQCCDPHVERPDVHHNHDHSELIHDGETMDDCGHFVQTDHEVGSLHALCGCCQRSPHHDHSPLSSCDISCSFVQSSSVVVAADPPLVEYLMPQDIVVLGQRVEAVAFGPRYWISVRGGDSMSHCAALCSWRL